MDGHTGPMLQRYDVPSANNVCGYTFLDAKLVSIKIIECSVVYWLDYRRR